MKKLTCIAVMLSTFMLNAQSKEIVLPNGTTFLVGEISVTDLKTNSYQSWFEPQFENYTIDNTKSALIASKLKTYNLLLFMGTWCGDSKREVPKIIKLLSHLNFPMNQLKIVAVDQRKEYYKKSPGGEEWGLHIKRVPTLIFLKNGKEVNRIIETPVTSWEADFFAIVSNQTYNPNYEQTK